LGFGGHCGGHVTRENSSGRNEISASGFPATESVGISLPEIGNNSGFTPAKKGIEIHLLNPNTR